MGDWIAIAEWHRCAELARPGIVFELRNAEGLSLFAACGPLPAPPFDWSSPPVVYRPVAEPAPQHSGPLPPPAGTDAPAPD
jgi:hypothetical protein